MAKYQRGDRVTVKSAEGEAKATVIGVDRDSGTYRVRVHEVTHHETGKVYRPQPGEAAPGYAAPNQMRRA